MQLRFTKLAVTKGPSVGFANTAECRFGISPLITRSHSARFAPESCPTRSSHAFRTGAPRAPISRQAAITSFGILNAGYGQP